MSTAYCPQGILIFFLFGCLVQEGIFTLSHLLGGGACAAALGPVELEPQLVVLVLEVRVDVVERELCVDGVGFGEVLADVALSVDDDVGAVAAAVAGPLVPQVDVVDVRVQLVRGAAQQPAPETGASWSTSQRREQLIFRVKYCLSVHSLVAALPHLWVGGAEVPAHPVPRGGDEAAEDALAMGLAAGVRLLVHTERVRVREYLKLVYSRFVSKKVPFRLRETKI